MSAASVAQVSWLDKKLPEFTFCEDHSTVPGKTLPRLLEHSFEIKGFVASLQGRFWPSRRQSLQTSGAAETTVRCASNHRCK